MSSQNRISTKRLLADEWHALERELNPTIELAKVVQSILTPSVTASLPAEWQAIDSEKRACEWIGERDRESTNLLVIDRMSKTPVGIFIWFEDDASSVRIGYMIAEAAWGKGLATELLSGFVDWCRYTKKRQLIAGVAASNSASQKVLRKCGFSKAKFAENSDELCFELSLKTN